MAPRWYARVPAVGSALVAVLTLSTGGLGSAHATASSAVPSATVAQVSSTERDPVVSSAVRHDTSAPLRDLPKATPRPEGSAPTKQPVPTSSATATGPLPTSPTAANTPATPMPPTSENFPGLDNVDGYYPPDTNGDVGPGHYIQMVNASFAIFDKTGTMLYGPVPNNTLWGGFGGPCQIYNDGDPIVQYDGLADRWLISQFAVSGPEYFECVAVSATGDPLGAYHRYAFSYGTTFPDYPKVGVWPDGYYVTYNMYGNKPDAPIGTNDVGTTGATTCALERRAMLAGADATQQCFNQPDEFSLQPADVDGPVAPPAGSPNYVVGVSSTANDALTMFRFAVDWDTPANTTFSGPVQIPVAPFTRACSAGDLEGFCVPQPGTTALLDSMGPFTMYRLAYRNYGSHESLVVNHAVATDGNPGLTSQVGIRWYELRSPGAPTPQVYQQGTVASPVDGEFRWMASMAMDRQGNIGMGYSSSSSTLFPSINYLGRLASDPLGTMPYEQGLIKAGAGSQTGEAQRWGDYTNTSVDPLDDCTFWHTNEYLKATSGLDWSTQIASFRFPGCTGSTTVPGAPASASATRGIGQIPVTWTAPTDTGNLPIIGYQVTASPGGATCRTTVGVDPNPLTCTVRGLANGTLYRFDVTAVNALGAGPATPTAQITPGSALVPRTPVRVADTRPGQPVNFPANKQPIPAGGTLEVPIAGQFGVPADAAAVSLNVTAVGPASAGHLTVYPCGTPKPNASTINFATRQTVANAALSGSGPGGTVCITTSSTTDLVVDLNGWLPLGAGFSTTQSERVADTRLGQPVAFPPAKQPIAAGGTLEVPIAGKFGVPADAAAVSVNVTAVGPVSAGHLTVYPCGSTPLNASNLNFTAGQTVANAALPGIGTGGKVCITSSSTTGLIVDLNGWFAKPPGFTVQTPSRAADTRQGQPVAFPLPKAPLAAGTTLEVPVGGLFGIPADAGAVSLNVTVVGPVAAGHLRVYPCGMAPPNASTVNFTAGRIIANAAVTGLGTGGKVCVISNATTEVIVDVNGWFPRN